MNIGTEVDNLVEFIRETVSTAKKCGCVVGVSGGVDSAVVVALCKKAFPNTTLGINLPRFENLDSSKRAQELCENLDIPHIVAPIFMEDVVSPYKHFSYDNSTIKEEENPFRSKMAEGNYSARLRMARLYFYAELLDSLVVGTDNATENYLGFFTKYGDGGVDINPIGEYYKDEVYELASYLNVPESILKATPSAELFEGHTDEDELGMIYETINKAIRILKGDVPNDGSVGDDILKKLEAMHLVTTHKRLVPSNYNR